MKKLLAVALCLAMLLSTCAMADSLRLRVSDIRLYENDAPVLDLTGVDVDLLISAPDSESFGMRASCAANGAELAALAVAMRGEVLYGGYGSSGALSDLYCIDAAEVMTDELRQQFAFIYDTFEQIGNSFAAGKTGGSPSLDGMAGNIPTAWVTASGPVQFGGETCEGTLFALPHTVVQEVLRAIAVEMDQIPELRSWLSQYGVRSFSEGMTQINLSAEVSGGVYEGSAADYLDLDIDLTVLDGETLHLDLTIKDVALASGEQYSLALTARSAGSSVGFAVDFAANFEQDDAWMLFTPADAVDLNTVDMDALGEKVERDLQSLAGMVVSGVMSVMYNNQLGTSNAFAR